MQETKTTEEQDHSSFAQQLDEAGFFVWRKLFPGNLIDAHLSGFEALLGEDRSFQATLGKEFRSWHYEHRPTLELIHNDSLISFLQYRFHTAPVMGVAVTTMCSPGQGPHADSQFYVADPRGCRLRIWIALEDVHPDSGPIYFVPESHRKITMTIEEDVLLDHPELRDVLLEQSKPTTVEAFNAAWKSVPRYVEERVEKNIASLGLPKVAPILEKGDAVIFDVDTIHGSTLQNNKGLTRKSLMVFWSSLTACYFGPRYYWGPSHDFRYAEYAIKRPILQTPFGYRVDYSEQFRNGAFDDDYSRPVVKH